MSDPWDRPPIPDHGDDDEDTTYAGIGRVTSEWENVELALGNLYGLFVGQFGKTSALREYGLGAVFTNRVERLAKAHESFFQKRPNQDMEAEFCKLMARMKKFADRRHDVAHGIMRPIHWTRAPNQNQDPIRPAQFQFCVLPPYYKGNHFDSGNLPIYVYTYAEMTKIQGAMHGATHEVISYTWKAHRLISDNS